MPSSISSSEPVTRRDPATATPTTVAGATAPRQRWGLTWITAVLLTIVSLVAVETFWRSRGHLPSVVDDPALWSYHRHRVYHGRHTVVLLGSSEVQTSFSTAVFRDRFPEYTPVQLAILGMVNMRPLYDIARDENFRGIVICPVHELRLFRRDDENVDFSIFDYHEKLSSLNQRIDQALTAAVQAQLATVNPAVSIRSILSEWWYHRRLPRPVARRMHFDRQILIDFDYAPRERIEEYRTSLIAGLNRQLDRPSLPPKRWLKRVLEIESAVQQIKRRGGDVVFVQFPFPPEVRAKKDAVLPKDRYWDRFAANSAAVSIHHRDLPILSTFDFPDGAHLDYRDAASFTEALLDELVRRGVLPETADRATPIERHHVKR